MLPFSRVVKPELSRRPGSDPSLWNAAGDVGADPGVTTSRVCQMGMKIGEIHQQSAGGKKGQLIGFKIEYLFGI